MKAPEILRCPECRTRRRDPHLMALHVLACTRPLCHCMRIPHPHRPGGYALCEHRPFSNLLIAERMGADAEQLLELAADLALNAPGRPTRALEAPF